jgi:hemolysin activation/secretion protein
MYNNINAQEISLTITSKKENENRILGEIEYIQRHLDSTSLNTEIFRVSNYLKNLGYFTNTIDKIEKKNKKYIAYFSLNNKIEIAIIKINSNSKTYFENSKLENNTISIPLINLQTTLSTISKKLDDQGKSFSKVQLKNILIKDKTLFADLFINQSKKRIISSVIVKGYENFPTSYLKNYFNIKSNTVINQQKIKEISKTSLSLPFIKIIKSPEVLFTKDSTQLYLYLNKKQNNSFDGLVSFASKENGDVLFNGNIDLSLSNIFDTGEKFELFWNSIGEEKQEFKLSTEIPYIFNSKFTPQISFSIYKQDSTFLSTKFNSKLFYKINNKARVSLTYSSESSENLGEILENNNTIKTFSNYFIGFQLEYKVPKNDFFLNDKFSLEVNPTLGKRKTDNESSNQFKIETSTSYIWDLNIRNSIYIKNRIGYLSSDTLINNELFRIGGANSIRGFNEQSLITNNYNYFNLEYRYLTSKKSFIYTITDIGKIKVNSKNENILGLGIGYFFTANKSLINISTSLTKTKSQTTDFNALKLNIIWKNIF